jgi:hypothetical protein
MHQHLSYAWSTLIALAAGGAYALDRPDYLYNPFIHAAAMAYFSVDLFTCRPIYKLHHVCACWLIYALWSQKNPILSLFLCKMELTTLLYNVLQYAPDSWKQNVMGAFFLSFLKIRVLDYYFFLQDPLVELWFHNHSLLRVCFYTLYAINLYWFSLMIKKCCGNAMQGARYAVLCQHVAAYSYLGVLPAARACPKMLAAHTFTALTSFFYHSAVAANAPRVGRFVLDSVAVHAITFLNMSVVETCVYLKSFSGLVNLAGLAARVALAPKYNLAITMSYVPIALDCAIIAASGAPTPLKFDYALQLYCIFLCLHVKFFNEMTFVCVHVILWFNAHTMAQLVCCP